LEIGNCLHMDQLNHNIVEQDIERLSKEIAEKRELPEHKQLPEKELVRQALEPMIKQPVSQPSQPQPSSTAPTGEKNLPNYLKDSPKEIKVQVEKLVDKVFSQGIEKTIKEANQSSAFILDAFHDALTDKLYDELKKRKMI